MVLIGLWTAAQREAWLQCKHACALWSGARLGRIVLVYREVKWHAARAPGRRNFFSEKRRAERRADVTTHITRTSKRTGLPV